MKGNGYNEKLEYSNNNNHKAKRKRNIIWYNPPYSVNVKTNIGRKFLDIINVHFKNTKLEKIFNRNTVKLSYSCMPNLEQIIKGHNAKLMRQTSARPNRMCNCRGNTCPLDGQCLTPNVVYMAEVVEIGNSPQISNAANVTTHNLRRNPSAPPIVTRNNERNSPNANTSNSNSNAMAPDGTTTQTNSKVYIGATENFKERFRNHQKAFRNRIYETDTELSKHIWQLKDKNTNFEINWKILKSTSGYNKTNKLCQLCLSEKYFICYFNNKNRLLNKRNELVSKCRHGNKSLLKFLH